MMRFIKTISVELIFLVLFQFISVAQPISPKDIVTISTKIDKGNKLTLELNLDIKESWHINSNKPFDEFLTPTTISLKDSSLFKEINIIYPTPQIVKLDFSDTDLSLYEDHAIIKVVLTPKEKNIKKGYVLEGEVLYQPCNNQTCLFPTKKLFKATL